MGMVLLPANPCEVKPKSPFLPMTTLSSYTVNCPFTPFNSKYALIKKYGVSPGQLTRLKRDESVSTHTVEQFCRILDCRVEDVLEYIPDDAAPAGRA